MKNLQKHYWIINGIAFQLAWFVSVAFGNAAALIAATILLLLHSPFTKKNEWLLIIQITVIGWFYNQILFRTDVLIGNGSEPIWLHAIWPIFAATLCHSLKFFMAKRWLAVLCGALFAPASYYGGALLSGTQMGLPVLQYVITISLSWAVLMLLFHFMIQRLITDL